MRQGLRSFLFITLMTLITGFVYPLIMTALSYLLFPNNAQGRLLKNTRGEFFGSEWVAQGFQQDRYFWPRPSAVDYNPLPSGASHLAPTSQTLQKSVEERRARGGINELLLASGSGLDPHVSPAAALSQVSRVAQARGVSEDDLRAKVRARVEQRQFRILGEERVNILLLNRDIDQMPK